MSSDTRWIAGFRSAVIDPHEKISLSEPRGFDDQTVRQTLRLHGGGERFRILLSNRYGRAPLEIGNAGVALRGAADAIVTETARPVSYRGAAHFSIPAGEELVSDPIDVPVTAGADLALSLYLPGATGLATFSHMLREISYVTRGNAVTASALPGATEVEQRFFVTGVDVLAPSGTVLGVAFGDSWFEGVGTTVGANRRSVDVLGERLTGGWVVNQGISGNRLLTDEIGEHALGRFERDVLAVPGVSRVLLAFGINDLILGALGGQPPATADGLIAGFTELAARAHANGLIVHAATLGPYAGCVFPDLPVRETQSTRTAVNEWMRGTDVFDAVFDVDRAVADPDRPTFIRPDFDSGDGMHLNDAGARAMAGAVDIDALFG
ncbi:GDSL-type esterase/lipase family protein [Nocardia noduli]|uniref:GDSL-type esterase/lipase family protein n=1 Tax=Nocardia noduli TaxID=2815722 RepID=UPI0020B2A40D|nr:GDSL-type esterase/lipase family protein [Nocardia noduli]